VFAFQLASASVVTTFPRLTSSLGSSLSPLLLPCPPPFFDRPILAWQPAISLRVPPRPCLCLPRLPGRPPVPFPHFQCAQSFHPTSPPCSVASPTYLPPTQPTPNIPTQFSTHNNSFFPPPPPHSRQSPQSPTVLAIRLLLLPT